MQLLFILAQICLWYDWSLALTTVTCNEAQFQMRSGWELEGTPLKRFLLPNPQRCAAACMDNDGCQTAGYDFSSMLCTLSTQHPIDCIGPNFSGIDANIYFILGSDHLVTFDCFRCLDDEPPPVWTRSWRPETELEADNGLLSDEDKEYIRSHFSVTYTTPQCVVRDMSSVRMTRGQYGGRWWGIMGAGSGVVNTQSWLLDMYEQEDPSLLILREVANRNGTCTESYFSYQEVQSSDNEYLWQKTVNYTVDPNVLRWAELGRTYSVFFKILYNNTNLMVQYVCMSPNVNGTCPPDQGFIFVNSRVQAEVADDDLDALNVFLDYTCLSNYGHTFSKMNPEDECVNDYANPNRSSIYFVRKGCDYTNIEWIKAHSTIAPYDSLVENENWAGVNGDWFGQVTVLEYLQPYLSENKLFVPMYRQMTNDTNSCYVINTTAWAINDTAEHIPGFFPTENLWVQTSNPEHGVSQASNTLFWRIAHDGVIASTISCAGAVPCRDSSSAFAGGSRRYRKSSVFIFRIRLYPAIARACINPGPIKNCPGIRPPIMTCGAERDDRSCLNSDLSKLIYNAWDITKFSGTWILNLALTNQPLDAMACNVAPSENRIALACYTRVFGNCQGPWMMSILQNSNAGNLTWTFNDPVIGTYTENLIVVWQTATVVAFYGCSYNGKDHDGSCRDDRMIAMVFTKKDYVLTEEDNIQLNKAYNSVCLWTLSQIFPLNTQDDCIKPLYSRKVVQKTLTISAQMP